MKIALLPLLFVFSITLFAQNENTSDEFPNAKASYLTFDLATPVDPIAPRFRVGYIQSLNKELRISVDLGYGNESTTVRMYNIDDSDNYRLVEARTEVYYIFNPTKKVNHYISGELYFVQHREDIRDDFYKINNSNIRVRYDFAEYEREKYGFNLKYGVMIPFGTKVGMNIYVGAGPRYRNVSFSNIINLDEYEYHDDDDDWEFFVGHYRKEGKRYGFNLAFGFKLFYRL